MSTNKKLMTGRMVHLDIAVTLYFLEPETLYGVTEATRTLFETNESMRRRLSRQVLRKNLKPEATGQCPGGQTFGQFSGETLRGMYRDWGENEQRAMLALRLLRWLAAQKGKGCVSDPEPLLHQMMRLTAFGLDAVLHDLATNEHPNPDAATIARAIRDLTPEARITFLDRFGTKPIPGVTRKREKPKKQRVSVLVVSRKWAGILAAAIVFFFFAASPFRWQVAWSVLAVDGPFASASYAARSGILYSDSPRDIQTSAYLAYRTGKYKKAEKMALKVLALEDSPARVRAEAKLVLGHVNLARGNLSRANADYADALEAYTEDYDKTFAYAGLAKVARLQGQKRLYLRELYEAFVAAGGKGDFESYAYLDLLTNGEPSLRMESYLATAQKRSKSGEAWIYIAMAKRSLDAGDTLSAEMYAGKGKVIASDCGDHRAEIFSLVILNSINERETWTKQIRAYQAKQPDYELNRFISGFPLQ